MSLHSVERLLYDLNRDPTKVASFQAEPDAVLAGYELTEQEAAWLVARDILALYRHGVHPLLLAPASRFFQIDQRDFRTALAPAVGERLR
jgi:aromatic-ring opening dioxygenase LigAB LigA subunit